MDDAPNLHRISSRARDAVAIDAAIEAMQAGKTDPAWRGGLAGYLNTHGHAPVRPPCGCMVARWRELGVAGPGLSVVR